ncbi:MAG TPA: hypothetical protein VF037_11765 [Gemmatimonadales bacterium]
MEPSPTDPPPSSREAHPATHHHRARIRLFHAAVTTLATLGGIVMGFMVTLAIVVAKSVFGYFIFGLEDLLALRWEVAPVLVGGIAGYRLGRRRPHSVAWATVSGVGGLLVGVSIGSLAGWELGGDTTGRWAGGIIGGALGLVGGTVASLRIRRVPRHPLIAAAAAVVAFLGAVSFALFGATNLIDIDPLEFGTPAGVPMPEPASVDAVVFLLGDAGAAVKGRSPLLDALQADVERWSAALARDSAVSVAYLGDLVYPSGIHDRDHSSFPTDSARLWDQVSLVGGPAARRHATVGLFVTGNHDWGNTSGDVGLDRIGNLGEQLAAARQAGHLVALFPAAGEPGPAVRDLRRNVRIAFFDTHWFLQQREGGLRRAFFERLEEVLEGARDREVILVSHHPYYSAGPHGAIVPGYHTYGVAYALKKAGALVQDLNSPAYGELLAGLRRTFEASRKPPLIYAGGHDHSLQVLTGAGDFDPRFAVVSGAGSKVSSIQMGPGLVWGGSQPGYMMLVFRKDDGVDLFVVAGDADHLKCEGADDEIARCMAEGTNAFEIAYSASLLGPSKRPRELTPVSPDTVAPGTPWWTDEAPIARVDSGPPLDLEPSPVAVPARVLLHGADSVTTTPGRTYPAGRLRRLFAGDLNRHLWQVPVRLPVLDLDSVAGGLHPSEIVGGKQTVGLRFTGRDGLEYDFRPVVKQPLMIPERLRDGPIGDLFDDQMAGQLPFSAVVVAALEDALAITSPTPVAVVMPNDPRLGQYRAMFAGRVGLFAVHPDERSGGRRGFAGYTNIVGSDVVFDSVRKDPGSAFDARTFLRIRLVDFLVGDWDRHAGQWRWGRRIVEGRTMWRPIPEDRDWALSHIDGLTARVARVLFPSYVGFSEAFPPITRLARSGREVDRAVLNPLDRSEFIAAAREVQAALSDSIIGAAVGRLPPPYVALDGARLAGAIRTRRQRLVEYAEEFYRSLAREIEVHTYANRPDTVEFTRLDAERAGFRIRSGGPDGGVAYERVIDGRDTRRVRLFADRGEDTITGSESLPFDVEIVDERPE